MSGDTVFIVAERQPGGGWYSPLRAADGTPEMLRDVYVARVLAQSLRAQGVRAEVLTFDLATEWPTVI